MEGKRGSECLLKSVSNIDFNPQRTEYTFESIVNESGPTNTVAGETEEMDLFAGSGFFEEKPKAKLHRYKACRWTDIYKQEIE
ncbi:hypothetical protein [Fructilactobacillus lindneri]|uniref:Uncharacterized protein n=1 Tax=Fructilactobacillus lindneri DSM 20690 = JCM 11027 TaxID=1122148 RepID=A0A0R2JU42_9LACO|nr:hypothetical protein [Fructilactobacillus lindneri]KRN80555.1 hypothetical protein IV52_GL000008 [Fructilactobacillus lindneri DSM 20690 = JCM 11027]POH05084.1 hypothetical protein BGL35_06825 [Fructilactobacillus lindneri]POH22650.1 hypothetical protein BHU33_06860 [Fructilactobacillus lindneri DSM 20690 = JCM 11027]